MTCPFCGSETESGYAEMHAAIAESLFFGRQARTLRFSSSTGSVADILTPAERKNAEICPKCGGAVIGGETWTA